MRIKITRTIVAFVLTLLAYIPSSATVTSMADNGKQKSVSTEVLRSDINSHKVRVRLAGLDVETVNIDGKAYQLLSFPGCGFYGNVGEPQLPTFVQRVALPCGATFNVSISDERWETMSVGTLLPFQKDSKGETREQKFEISEKCYAGTEYEPSVISSGKVRNWRGIENVAIAICPFKYFPSEGRISFMTEFTLEISFRGGRKDNRIDEETVEEAKNWSVFCNDIKSFFTEEPARLSSEKNYTANGQYDYLIIVGNVQSIYNSQALKDFVKWKTFKGYKTKVVNVGTVGSTSQQIKEYIRQEYNHGVRYVLFVGDYDQIPLHYETIYTDELETAKSDYWYGCLLGGDDDYEAEIPIGRFSTNNVAELTNMVNKSIEYEKSFDGDFDKILLAAHKDFPYNPLYYQSCCESIRNNTYPAPLNFTVAYGTSTSQGGNNATNSYVVDKINSGMHIVNYRGHGEYNRWGMEGNPWNIYGEFFYKEEINNINTKSLYFNVCCQNGDITEEPCWMETFTRAEKGAIACLAATGQIWRYSSTYYDRFLFERLYNQNIYKLGELNILSHMDAIDAYEPMESTFNALCLLCGGDPTLEIWTSMPQVFPNVTMSEGNGSITVSTSISGYTFSVISNDGTLLYKTNVSGNSLTWGIPGNKFYIVLNKQGYRPYIIEYNGSGFIQNETIDCDLYYAYAPHKIGRSVTTTLPYGKVVVKSGSKLHIARTGNEVYFGEGFECEVGGEITME